MYRIFHQYTYGIDFCYSLAFLTLKDHFFCTVCGDRSEGKEEGVVVYFKARKGDDWCSALISVHGKKEKMV